MEIISYVNEVKEDWTIIYDSSLPKDAIITPEVEKEIREFFSKFKTN